MPNQFGRHWNDEVLARHEAKQGLYASVLEHRGKVRMDYFPGKNEWEPPEWLCRGCKESFGFGDHKDGICPAIMHDVTQCREAGCTEAEIRMVCMQAVHEAGQ